MDDYRVEASIVQSAFHTFNETQRTIQRFLSIFFLQDDDLHKDRVQQVAIVYVINDWVVCADSNVPRSQGYLAWPASHLHYSLEKNLKPSHSNLKKPIIISMNFMESRFTTEAMYLLTCQKGIWIKTSSPVGRWSCARPDCKQRPERWRRVWLLWLASGCCSLTAFCSGFSVSCLTYSLILIVYNVRGLLLFVVSH